jgi:hypothetical protein
MQNTAVSTRGGLSVDDTSIHRMGAATTHLSPFEAEAAARTARLREKRERNTAAARSPYSHHDRTTSMKLLETSATIAAIPPPLPPPPPPPDHVLRRRELIAKVKLPFLNVAKVFHELLVGVGLVQEEKPDMTAKRDPRLKREFAARSGADISAQRMRRENVQNAPLVFDGGADRGLDATINQKSGGDPDAERFALPGNDGYNWQPLDGMTGNHNPPPLRTNAVVRIVQNSLRANRLLIPHSSPQRVYFKKYEDEQKANDALAAARKK